MTFALAVISHNKMDLKCIESRITVWRSARMPDMMLKNCRDSEHSDKKLMEGE